MANTTCTADFERALVLLLSATPRSISDDPRLSSLLHEFLEEFFQRCTPEELSHFVPTSVRTALGSRQPSASLADSPGSVGRRPTPTTALDPPHSGPLLPITSSTRLSNDTSAEDEFEPVSLSSGKRPPPGSSSASLLRGAKARKKSRTEPSPKNVKKAQESLMGIANLRRFPPSSIWGSRISRSSIVEDLCLEPSVHKDDWETEVELPLKRCGEVWKRNRTKKHEPECARRFLGLFIVHVADYCESLPEIPRPRRRGCSKRTWAYEMITLETGESASDIARIVAASKKYLRLAAEAGLSRLLEIDSTKSWVWEKLLNDIDIAAVCKNLRSQHKTMSNEEKTHRSECDFLAAQEIITMLERLGKTVSKLVEVDTELTRVLRKFVDFEGLCQGRVDPTGGDFYGEKLSDDTESPLPSSQMIQHVTYEGLRESTHAGRITKASERDSEDSSIMPAQDASQAPDSRSDPGYPEPSNSLTSGSQHPPQIPQQRRTGVDGLDALLLAADADLSHSHNPLSNSPPTSDALWHSSTLTNAACSQDQTDMQLIGNLGKRTPHFNMMHSHSQKDGLWQDVHDNAHQSHIQKPRVNALCYDLQLGSPASNFQSGSNTRDVHESSAAHISPTTSPWVNTASEPHQTTSSEAGTSLRNNQYQELSTVSDLWDPFDFWPDGVENTIPAVEEW